MGASATTTAVWSAGWNIPGYLPDDEPAHFDTWEEARAYLSDELARAADEEHTLGNPQVAGMYDTACARLNQSEPDERFHERVGNYVWWVEHIYLPEGEN